MGPLGHFGPSGPFWAPWAILGHFRPFWAILGTLGHFGQFWALWAILGPLGYSVPYGPFWALWGILGPLGHFESFWAADGDGRMFKKNIGALWRNPFLVVCQIHLNQRSDQLLSGCLICWSKARRWLIKRRGKWWSSWRPTSGWFRTFGAGGQQPGGGLGPSETISSPGELPQSYTNPIDSFLCQ